MPFEKFMEHGGKKSRSRFNRMMKSSFVLLQESWRRKGYGLGLKVSQDGTDEEKVTHYIFLTTVILFLRAERNSVR